MSNISISYVQVRYAYTTRELSKSSIDIAYGYTSTSAETFVEQSVGTNAPATQGIMNNLPQWMEMRKNRSSNGWKLTNSWGQNLEHIVDITKSFIQEQFIATTDITQRSSLYSFNITDRELVEERVFNNLLFNSSFSIRGPVRIGMPSGWARYSTQHRKTTYLIHDRSFIGSGSIVVEGSGIFGQSVAINNILIKDITGSCYFLSNGADAKVKLIVIAETIDGKLISSETMFKGSSTEWRRLESTLVANQKIFRIHFVVHASNCTSAYFNAPKLEVSDKATRWCKSGLDGLPYTSSFSNFSQVRAVSG